VRPIRPSGRERLPAEGPRHGQKQGARTVLAVIRTTGYTNSVRDAAQFFKVLADEARLKMLWLLFNHRELCVCDLMAALGITQSKASRHLATLRHADLVTDRKDGLWSYYKLRPLDDAFAREELALLKASLAKRPDSAPLLAKLHEWLGAKNRGAVCAPARSRPSKRAPKAPRKGAVR
jgi:ArsR family transcriptional regulator, arsenate/arsenite/antimonite-responsive transcriptional repressor